MVKHSASCQARVSNLPLVSLQLQEQAENESIIVEEKKKGESDQEAQSDQDGPKDCNGRVIPRLVLERSDTVDEVRCLWKMNRMSLVQGPRYSIPLHPEVLA